MKEIQLKVNGMVCGGCKKRVENALNAIDGINGTVADYETGLVVIKANDEIDINVVKEKIEDIGFEVEEN